MSEMDALVELERADKLDRQLDALLARADSLAGQLGGLAGTVDQLAAQVAALLERDDRLGGQLGALEDWLRIIARHVEPQGPVIFPSSTSLKLENSRVVASGNTQLYGFSGVNTKTSAQFILAFDATAVPANGAVPDVVVNAPASDNFWLSWAPAWRDFSAGVVLCNSSTAATLTIGAADCWFDAQYLALPPA